MVALMDCSSPGARAQAPPAQEPSALLRHVKTIDLPGVEGRFDHFAVDPKGKRLLLAALGNNTLEVFDTAALTHVQSVKGLRKPTGVAFIPDSNRVAVANGDDGTLRFYDATTLKPGGQVEGLDDADNVRYDPAARRLYAGYGSGALAVIDAIKQEKVGDIKLDAHPESFQLERDGKRIFVNVPEARHVAIIDREQNKVVAKWPVTEAGAHFPMALDEASRRLFIGCREPAKLLVKDTATGKTVASVDCAGDTDDLFYDASNRRLYVSGGAGLISIIEQLSADEYRVSGSIKTAAGARTSFFASAAGNFYLAVPHRGQQRSELRVFETPRLNRQ
jgi:DNA-binding beta-propeller fold protein YncE